MKVGLVIGSKVFNFNDADTDNIGNNFLHCNNCLLNRKKCENMCHRIEAEYELNK